MILTGDLKIFKSHRISWLICEWPPDLLELITFNLSMRGWFTMEMFMVARKDF